MVTTEESISLYITVKKHIADTTDILTHLLTAYDLMHSLAGN